MTVLFIPYVNRLDLLMGAVTSIGTHFDRVFIVDNSMELFDNEEAEFPDNVSIAYPPIPLRFVDTMNYIQETAVDIKRDYIEWDVGNDNIDYYFWCHNDAFDSKGNTPRFIEFVKELHSSGDPWSIAFTHYDILSAVNLAAVEAVGRWDTNINQYYADNDWYRRCRLAGLPTKESNLHIDHIEGSATMNSDKKRTFRGNVLFAMQQYYYTQKWGGVGGEEQYDITWNRPDLFTLKD